MVPIRDVVIFPFMMVPFVIGRESSVNALEAAMQSDKRIFLATQHDATIDNPKPGEIFPIGTIANIVQSLKLPDGNTKVLVEGIERARILQMSEEDGYIQATLRLSPFRTQVFTGYDTLQSRLTQQFEQYLKLSQNVNAEQLLSSIRVDEIGRLADVIAANLVLSIEEKQELVEIFNPVERCKKLVDVLEIEIDKLQVDRTVQNRVKRQMERAQKEYYLNEKIKAIQKELGKKDERSEIDELRRKVETAGMPKDANEKAMQ
jgi:ATP-dependent Lon protease